jgi:hypothetical protein
LLQKAIKLGKDVLLAYQSPPPLYFNLAIFKAGAGAKEELTSNNNPIKI